MEEVNSPTTLSKYHIDSSTTPHGGRKSISKSYQCSSSLKTPGTSSVTKFHNRVFKFHTCCGILELNCLKVTSMMALMVILIAFCSLVAIIAINYSVVTGLYSKVEFLQSDATHYRELMKISSRIAAITDYNRTLSLQYEIGR